MQLTLELYFKLKCVSRERKIELLEYRVCCDTENLSESILDKISCIQKSISVVKSVLKFRTGAAVVYEHIENDIATNR